MPKPRKIRISSDETPQEPHAPEERGPAAGAHAEEGQAAPEEAVVERPEARIRRLEEQLEAAERRAEELNEKHLRALADFENYRRRARQERAEATRSGEATILLEVLPVLDNFGRAVEAAQESNDAAALIAGVKMIHDHLLEALKRKGVRPIEAEGEPFDPTYHDAVGKVETADRPDGTVAVEIQKGYMLGDRVLRPSRVLVAVQPACEAERPRESGPEES
jgi:molecular chaperone GrpE